MKHIICYSGGVQSALVAIMVTEKFGKKNVVLLNHEVRAEPDDVGRFEREVALFLGIEITYANGDQDKYPDLTPLDVALYENAWSIKTGLGEQVLCTNRLKTAPFMEWLETFYKEGDIIYYGFSKKEMRRVQRRSFILGKDGYKTDFPLALWEEPLPESFLEKIGIKNLYSMECLNMLIVLDASKGESSIGIACMFMRAPFLRSLRRQRK